MTSCLPNTVEHWPLDGLIPPTRNARTHSEKQVAQIAISIAKSWSAGDGVIIAGHGRVLAARKLGLTEAR